MNVSDIIIVAALFICVAAAVIKIVIDKKNGRGCCGCSASKCKCSKKDKDKSISNCKQ